MKTLLTQEEYWNKVAEEKELTTPLPLEVFKKNVPVNARILDVGCGYGRTLHELYEAGYTALSGIDISRKMIARGRRQYPQLDLKQYEGTRLPFEDDSFDAVLLLAVLTCILEDVLQEQLLAEIHRVLRKDGVISINDFLLNSDQRNVERYQRYEKKYNEYGIFELREGVAFRHHSRARIDKLTSSFTPIIFDSVVYTTMNGHKSKGLYFLGRCGKETGGPIGSAKEAACVWRKRGKSFLRNSGLISRSLWLKQFRCPCHLQRVGCLFDLLFLIELSGN